MNVCKRKIIPEYVNSTLRSNDWGLYFTSPTYKECLVIFIILFYGLRIQIQKLNHQRFWKEYSANISHLSKLVYLHEGL